MQLREDITSGTYKYGGKLPSKRLLAEETGRSVITVEHAYNILCDEGYVEARQRSGYFVTYQKGDFVPVRETDNNKQDVFATFHHRDEEFPFSVFSKTMRSVLNKYGERLFIKAPDRGSIELRSAICDYLARGKGISVTEGQVIIGSGAEYLYGLVVQLLGRERVYAIESPSYEKIHSVYRANGAECELLKLGKDGIVSSELKRTCASVLHVTPFRSFPTGVTASASKRNEYIEWARGKDRCIIEDDFDSEFTVLTKNEDTLFSLAREERVIYINTFTKTVAPSMRIGYMILPKELMDMFDKKIGFYSCTVPVFEQYVLAEILNSGDFERHINRVRRKRRKTLKEQKESV